MNDKATPGRSGSATVRPFLLAPRDWQAMALREAAELTGTPEGSARLAESKRYGALADEIERLQKTLMWLDRWMGHKSLLECANEVRKALRPNAEVRG